MSVKFLTTLVFASSLMIIAPAYAAGGGGGGFDDHSVSTPSYDPVVEYQSGLKHIII